MNELEQIAIGLAIRKLRLDAKKTLKESAERCNNTKNWLVNIESGRRRSCSTHRLSVVAI